MNGWRLEPDGRPGALWRACLEAAAAAPSVHNTQPWRFRLAPGRVDVLVDRERRLDVLDPGGRELMISVGAAVLNLRVAVLHHGRTPLMTLLPDPSQPDLAARLTLGPPAPPPASASLLARAIPRRHTNRRPFSDTPVPLSALADLESAARIEGGRLAVADLTVREAVLSIVRTADRQWRSDPAYWREVDTWTRRPPEGHDGVPPEAFGPWDAVESVPLRDFGLTFPAARRRTAAFESEPTIAVLYTAGDNPEQWLRAGLALERVLLTATVLGLATTLMTQPLEIPRLRALLAESAAGLSAQAIIRCGYGPPSAPSPRRSVDELLAIG